MSPSSLADQGACELALDDRVKLRDRPRLVIVDDNILEMRLRIHLGARHGHAALDLLGGVAGARAQPALQLLEVGGLDPDEGGGHRTTLDLEGTVELELEDHVAAALVHAVD